jgi:uncharacterized protein YdeI (YjbR/CyaY-like superfamily)
MPTTDPRVDAYIAKSAPFAQPILTHLRKLVHKACPDVVENIKWGFPFFEYNGPLCNMAAFKAHCGFGFWKAKLIPDPKGLLAGEGAGSMGKISNLKDLPSDKIILDFIKVAMQLNADGVKAPAVKKAPKKDIPVPEDVIKVLAKNKKAAATFEAFSPSHRREYLEWIVEAKTEQTRTKRIATMLEWLAEGKARNWKYQAK